MNEISNSLKDVNIVSFYLFCSLIIYDIICHLQLKYNNKQKKNSSIRTCCFNKKQ